MESRQEIEFQGCFFLSPNYHSPGDSHFSISDRFAFDLTFFILLRFHFAFVASDPSLALHLVLPVPSSTMVTLTPRFTFLATLCALAALSSAPISDAAVLRLRTSASALTNMASGHSHAEVATWFPRHSSHVLEDPPVLPLPKEFGESTKNFTDSGDSSGNSSSKGDRKIPSTGGSRGEKEVSTGDNDNDPSYDDNGAVPREKGKVKVRVSDIIIYHLQSSHSFEQGRRWNPFRPIRQLSELWFGGKLGM